MSNIRADINQDVMIRTSTHQGAKNYIGQRGRIVSCNKNLAYGVMFDDGQVWFYNRDDFKKV